MKKVLITICLIISFVFLGLGQIAKADTAVINEIQSGIDSVAKSAGITELKAGKKNFNAVDTVIQAIGIGLSFIGVLFFLLMLYAGVMWMTAMGNTEKVESAKATLESAVIGLVIVLSAYAITSFVFKNILGVTPSTGSSVVAGEGEEDCAKAGGTCKSNKSDCLGTGFVEKLCKGKFANIKGSGCCTGELKAEDVKFSPGEPGLNYITENECGSKGGECINYLSGEDKPNTCLLKSLFENSLYTDKSLGVCSQSQICCEKEIDCTSFSETNCILNASSCYLDTNKNCLPLK
ncbi:MAG: pilin [bacterium]